jgi:hypothetical protein
VDPAALAGRLRAGEFVGDDDFDAIYPQDVAALSPVHWTPVDVAVRAAHLLAPRPDVRVLDLGAGPGKLCIIGALTTGASFVGIEQRVRLVHIAVRAASALAARRAQFVHANILEIDWQPYDAYYLYNPFVEQMLGGIDDRVRLERTLYGYYIQEVRSRLRRARTGARVVTYHGFGGELPPGFVLRRRERAGSDELELWIKGPLSAHEEQPRHVAG